jgi:hypothetical protein
MSYYTSAIETQIVDPQFNQSKYRSEFRITEDGLYTSAMRICNLGVLATAASATAERTYNLITGAGGVIKNIYLYDDKTVLDQVLNYKDYGAFKNLQASNSDNMDVKKNLKKHGLGFVYNTETPFTPATSVFTSLIKQYNPDIGGHLPTDSEETTTTGYLDLRDVFPLLKSLEFLPTSLFPKLRVVLEYDVNNVLTYSGTNGDRPTATTVPILVVDKVVDEPFVSKWVSGFKGISWNCVETENVILPTLDVVPSSGVQSVKYRLNGFNNKTLGNLLMQKKASVTGASLSTLYLNNSSLSMVGETMQVYVNGSALLPDSGVVAPNQRLGLLVDTFGNMNIHPGANVPCFPGADKSIQLFRSRVGELDYFGVTVGKKITQLEITFSRQYSQIIDEADLVNAFYKQQLQLQFFGTVAKSLIVGKGGYQIIYT